MYDMSFSHVVCSVLAPTGGIQTPEFVHVQLDARLSVTEVTNPNLEQGFTLFVLASALYMYVQQHLSLF